MINLIDLKNKVIELATTYPDAKYCSPNGGGCHYGKGVVENGPETPGCVIGQALRQLDDVTFARFHDYGGQVMGILRHHDYFDDDPKIENWLCTFQTNQDRGEAWGNCLDIANKENASDSTTELS